MDLLNTNFLSAIRRAEEIQESIRIHRDAGRDKDASQEIERICQQDIGVPFSIVRHSSPEMISNLLHQAGNALERSVWLAELLMQEAAINEEAGDIAGKVRAQLQAFCLLGEAACIIAPDERPAYRERMDRLASQLRAAGNDSYLREKLLRFGY